MSEEENIAAMGGAPDEAETEPRRTPAMPHSGPNFVLGPLPTIGSIQRQLANTLQVQGGGAVSQGGAPRNAGGTVNAGNTHAPASSAGTQRSKFTLENAIPDDQIKDSDVVIPKDQR